MIHYVTAYSLDRDIGKSYNEAFGYVGDDDWVCFVDGDAMFSTNYWGHHIAGCLERYPDGDCFTCRTNRVWCEWQKLDQTEYDSDSMEFHRRRGLELFEQWGTHCTLIGIKEKPMSGVLMMISKKCWKEVGGFVQNGKILAVDNDFHRRLRHHQKRLYRMDGVYVIHWYRGGVFANKRHLTKRYEGVTHGV